MLTVIAGIKVARHCIFGNGTEQRNKRKFCKSEKKKLIKDWESNPSLHFLCIYYSRPKENRQSLDDAYMNVMYGKGATPQDSSPLPLTVREEKERGRRRLLKTAAAAILIFINFFEAIFANTSIYIPITHVFSLIYP